ncbi:hypothetical protein E4T56_gene17922, partial [Termitomyces sp. T112]
DEAGRAIREQSLDAKNFGVQRQAELRQAAGNDGYVEDHLWTGIGRARSGCGAAIIGTPDQVLAKLRAYQAEGIEAFILSGYPHLEEAYRFAELVFPLLSLEQGSNVTRLHYNGGPFGETRLPPAQFSPAAGRRPDPVDRAARHRRDLAGRERHRLRAGARAAGTERRRARRLEAAALGRTRPQ